MRYALKFTYYGKGFHGFARQPNVLTVEGEIIRVLKENNIISSAKESVFRSASRTDKGVSAFGNVVAFNTMKRMEVDDLKDLNSDLNDIYFYGLKHVSEGFYPRYARMRWYRYYMRVDDLDTNRFLRAAVLFTGTHDFSNFARVEKHRSPVRRIENIVVEETENDVVTVDFFAQSFLWQQVRRMVAAMEKVGMNALDEKRMEYALTHGEERVDFGIANAESLVLVDVLYDIDFEVNEEVSGCLKEIEKRIVRSLFG